MVRLREALGVRHRREAAPGRHDTEEPVEEQVMRWLYGRRTGTVRLIRTATPVHRMMPARDRGSDPRRHARPDRTPVAGHAARKHA
jgi:hypothetical protein